MSLNDIMFNELGLLSYSGALPERLKGFWDDRGGYHQGNDSKIAWLKAAGASGGSYNDLLWSYWNNPDPIPNISNTFSYWKIDDISSLYEDDAGTTPATVGGPVGRVEDQIGTNHLIQGTVSSRPTLRRDSLGYLYLDFDGGDWMYVSDSRANFKFLHDGTGGGAVIACHNPNGESGAIASTATSSANVGMRLWLNDDATYTERLTSNILRGVAGVPAVPVVRSGGGTVPTDTGLVVTYTFTAADNLDIDVDNALVRLDAASAAPSTANSTNSFEVGAEAAGTSNFFDGRIYSYSTYDSDMSDADKVAIYNYLKPRMGS